MDLLLFLLEMDHLGRLLLGGRFFFRVNRAKCVKFLEFEKKESFIPSQGMT